MSVVIDGIVTGDDSEIPVTLTKGKAESTFIIDPGATVKASVVDLSRTVVLIPAVTCSNAASGADWANSLVIVSFSSAETSAITTTGQAYLEIQVDDGGKLTWFDSIDIIKGSIA